MSKSFAALPHNLVKYSFDCFIGDNFIVGYLVNAHSDNSSMGAGVKSFGEIELDILRIG